MLIFPIMLSSSMIFLFYRQANLKMGVIYQIDKRLILIHEVNQSLLALLELHRGKSMDDYTMRIIDKLIENILKNDIYQDTNIHKSDNLNLKDLTIFLKNGKE